MIITINNMSLQFEGKVVKVLPKQTFWSWFEKQTLILEEDSTKEYKQSLSVDFFKEKMKMLDSLKEGDSVVVKFNTKTKEHNGRYYNSINGRAIDTNKNNDGWWDLPF